MTKAVANVARDPRARSRASTRSTRRRSTGRLIELDGTPNKGRLGANAILGVSLAVAKAAAAEAGQPLYRYLGGEAATTLPVPMLNVINGGAHADNSIDLQEFMVVPGRRADASREGLRIGAEVYHALKQVLARARARDAASATRAASRPTSTSSEAAIEAILEAAERAGHRDAVAIALDPADERGLRRRRLPVRGPRDGERRDARASGPSSCERYPIVSIEDGLAEDDWDAWAQLTSELGDRVQLVGDDLFVTNPERLRQGIERRRRELDPRQGEPDRHADRDDRGRSARAGERLHGRHVAPLRARPRTRRSPTSRSRSAPGQIKTGAPARSDRVAKYNQLLRIEEELGTRATYPGWVAFPRARR